MLDGATDDTVIADAQANRQTDRTKGQYISRVLIGCPDLKVDRTVSAVPWLPGCGDVGCDVAIATVEYAYIAETTVIAGSTVIVIGEHQAHCCARVVLTHWDLVMNHTTPGVGRKVVNSPDLGAVQAENPVTVGEIDLSSSKPMPCISPCAVL